MFVHLHVVLLLLSWSCLRGSASKDHLRLMIFDRAASKSIANIMKSSKASVSDGSTIDPLKMTTIHYENSNGFVPMMVPHSWHHEFHKEKKNVTSGNTIDSRISSSRSTPNRRSFEELENQGLNDFELLKVNNDTPAVADYRQFYESVQSKDDDNDDSEDTKERSHDINVDRDRILRSKSRDRGRKMENYMMNYGGTKVERGNGGTNDRHYSYTMLKESQTGASSYAAGKVPSDFHGRYFDELQDSRRESGTRQRLATLPKINYDTVESPPRNKPKLYNSQEMASTVQKNRYRHSKSVVVPSASSADSQYDRSWFGGQLGRSNTSYESLKDAVDSSVEDQSDRFVHEALFNRDDDDRTEDSNEYLELTKRTKKIHNGGKRPFHSDVFKRLPKENREDSQGNLDSEGKRKRQHGSRSRSHRHRFKSNSWVDEDRLPIRYESSEERNYDSVVQEGSNVNPEVGNQRIQTESSKLSNSWTRVSPDIEISRSKGVEIDQIEKPKLIVPIKVNLVSGIAENFDHATALGNSQGFDVSNAVWQNYITPAPLLGTPAPVSNNVIDPNLTVRNVARNAQIVENANFGIATATVPDVIVGQNVILNPFQTVLVPKQNVPGRDELAQKLIMRHAHSTVVPVFAVNQNTNTNLLSTVQTAVPVQNYQNIATPRPTYVSVQSLTPNLQSLSVNQVQDVPGNSQFVVQHSTPRTLINVDQSAIQGSLNNNVQVNSNGLYGQNLISSENVPVVTLSARPTAASNVNLLAAESQNTGSNFSGSNGQFFATASLSVGDNLQREHNIDDNGNFYVHGQNSQQIVKPRLHENFYQAFKDDNLTPRTKAYIQNAQVSPTVLTSETKFNSVSFNNKNSPVALKQTFQPINSASQKHKDQSQQILKAANDIFENTVKQLQQLQRSHNTRTNNPIDQSSRLSDSAKSNSNVNSIFYAPSLNPDKARSPNVIRSKNVEILNSNIKPSPVDLTPLNPFENLNNYFANGILSTPTIPIFGTTNFELTPVPIISTTTKSTNLRNFIDPVTEIGARTDDVKLDLKSPLQNLGLVNPPFNPINFVPNVDLIKTQGILNSRLNFNEPLLPNLNLVSQIPEGNFYKNVYAAHNDVKPKLSSDLEKYAEEMFKESLKTIYNSQKWNNERKILQDQNSSESMDLSKLKNEFQHLQTSIPDVKHSKEILEAHYTENNVRTIEPTEQLPRPNVNLKKSESDFEHLFKMDFTVRSPTSTEAAHVYYDRANFGSGRPTSSDFSKQSDFGISSETNYGSVKDPNDFLTPPKPNSFVSNAPFFEQLIKKRPVDSVRYNFENTNSKVLPRPSSSSQISKPGYSEASASNNVEISAHIDNPHYEKFRNSENNDFEPSRQIFDAYPTFTTSIPENNRFKSYNDYENAKKEYYDFNHPRMHNLLVLLRKNKQLPTGRPQNYFRDKDELKQYFENEKRQLQYQFYENTLKNFQKKSDSHSG